MSDWWDVIGGIGMIVRDNEHGGRSDPVSLDYKRKQLQNPGMIGMLGPLLFQVSSQKIETFRDYERKTRSRIASHDVIGGEKSVLEYVGGEASEISFKMTLARDLGVNVEKELLKLDGMVNSGAAYYLVLGGDVIGYYKWYVSELGERLIYADRWAVKLAVEIDVSLREAVL